MLQAAVASLWSSLKAAAGVRVRYTDGDSASEAFTAVPGRSIFESEVEGGIVQTQHTQDWIFPAEDLVVDAQQILPGRLAVIEQLDDDDLVIARFEINAPSGARHYRFNDQFRVLLRVHTVEI